MHKDTATPARIRTRRARLAQLLALAEDRPLRPSEQATVDRIRRELAAAGAL